MTADRTYPAGVPCWVDVQQTDPARGREFYGGLFGWEFSEVAPGAYYIATLGGRDVAAVGIGDEPGWTTYVAVESADRTAERAVALGGTVVAPPADAGPGGRAAGIADPGGATFALWQPRRRPGAQVVNEPGSWNFSYLDGPSPARGFYEELFGWVTVMPGMWGRPGYGDHLASTVDPGIHERQKSAPDGFADAVAGVRETAGPPRWSVAFTVADRDASATTARDLGATVLDEAEDEWTRTATVRDPQGAILTLSQFAPTDW
jgi:uncharacterized protein